MSSNFWSQIPDTIKSELEKIAQIKKFQKGEIVFSENDSFKGFVVIKSGKFKIYNLNPNGKEAILRVMNEGEMAAGPLIFSGAPNYPATLESMENGSVFFFETNQFKQFLKTHPDFQNQFTSQMMQFMHYLKNKTSSLMLLNLKERLMEYLKENGAEHNFIQLKINKNQLALLLNATPESISRTFKALEEENLIEAKGESYKLIST
ncbi:MAG: Crp/Fnr family transcriptional regulator [Leptospiraceae bacterium]|jgi:CRP-like cAMP-binding protein|nr:Crp/Fnr family transcriptional regulator [Leptospiraceae bacterium]MBK7053465.1 Crp/Fnr family transcriptional regulator [Leptospiraceae bacterium]MBK9500408.1 Crp/Fnr family transcriptional regulator [Leptospiraceae bacterium]MBL0264812.1 Crp/Fnr family transcriptional regulator [Leptospiraceae bacterium]